jgi:hypothetical protein
MHLLTFPKLLSRALRVRWFASTPRSTGVSATSSSSVSDAALVPQTGISSCFSPNPAQYPQHPCDVRDSVWVRPAPDPQEHDVGHCPVRGVRTQGMCISVVSQDGRSPHAAQFADLSEYGYGVALLSESKYGFSCIGNVLSMSLLRAATAPDAEQDQGACFRMLAQLTTNCILRRTHLLVGRHAASGQLPRVGCPDRRSPLQFASSL